jgi:hypothetical protein
MISHYENWKNQIDDAYDAAGLSSNGFREQIKADSNSILTSSDGLESSVKKLANTYSEQFENIIKALAKF